MILYSISGVVTLDQIKYVSLDTLQERILQCIKKTHPDCQELKKSDIQEDIQLIMESDGIYYQLDIEA